MSITNKSEISEIIKLNLNAIEKFQNETANELKNHIMPFWDSLKDDRGGFFGFVDFNLNVNKNADKGVILNSRILWFYSNVYLKTGDETALINAKHAFEFLKINCYDEKFGGVYWLMTYDGKPLDDMKHAYNQAFAIYGLASYYDASEDNEALEIAYRLFKIIEEKCVDSFGYLDAFDREWNVIENDKLSEDGYNASKTMNTLLHVIEAYTELFRVGHNASVGSKLKEALIIFKEKVYNQQCGMLSVFFDEQMNSICDLYSYGHDIEASWLVDRACDVLCNESITAEIRKITQTIAANSIKAAFKNGTMNNQYCRGEIDTTRIWWVEAESVIGSLNAFQKNGEQKYLDISLQIWDYIKTYIIDKRENSEWFGYVNEKGDPIEENPIVEPWKCPYHNGRMCLEIMQRCHSLMRV